MTILFKQADKQYLKHKDSETVMPRRGDSGSAGYDFYAKEDFTIKGASVVHDGERLIPVFAKHMFFTDVTCEIPEDKLLILNIRSGMGAKHDLMLSNTQGYIDSSYFPRNIGISIRNLGAEDYVVKKGDKIAQGILVDYLITDDDLPIATERTGGFGSSGQ